MEELKGTVEQLDREIAKKRHQEVLERQDAAISLMASLGQSVDDLRSTIETTSERSSSAFEDEIAFLGDEIRGIKFEPTFTVPEVKIPTITVPEAVVKVELPEIKVPEAKVTVEIPEIVVPTPQVTVNVPDVIVPPFPEIPPIVMPESMVVRGDVGLRDVDNRRPLPVMLMGPDGVPQPLISSVSGGRGDYFTIKGFAESAFAVPINSDGEVKVAGTFVVGAPASTYVIAGNAEGLSYNSDNPLPVYLTSGAAGSTASALIDSSGEQYSGSNPVPVTQITGFATAANQLPDGHNVTVDNASIAVTGTFWQATQPVSGTVAVSGVSSSIGAVILNGEGLYRDTFPVTGTVVVSGVTASTASAIVDSTGAQYSGSNPVPTTDGFSLPLYDYLSLTETSGTDTFVYKRGGAGGTTVGTLTIVYVDDTRLTISTVTRT